MLTKKELKERIDHLDSKVSMLSTAARMKKGEFPNNNFLAAWDYIDVSEVVQLILDHLGLKIETNTERSPHKLVRKVHDDTQ